MERGLAYMCRTSLKTTWILAFLVLAPNPTNGQIPDSVQVAAGPRAAPDTVSQPTDSIGQITPGGAFLRSTLVPGWGHTKVGAHGRGAFYFTVEAVNAFVFLKTRSRLSKAKDRRALWESVVTARLQAQGVEDPEELETSLAEDPMVEDLRGLEEARSEQLEDWMALGIFFLFLGGADAFVSAHLASFPAPVEIEATPAGGLEIGFSVPVGF